MTPEHLTDEERQLLLRLVNARTIFLHGRTGGREFALLHGLLQKLGGVDKRVTVERVR